MSAAKNPRKSPKKQGPDKTWLEHQVDLANNRSDTARVTYALRHFHDIRKAKTYEQDPSKDVNKVPSFTGWKHFKELNEMELLGVADILLRFDWTFQNQRFHHSLRNPQIDCFVLQFFGF